MKTYFVAARATDEEPLYLYANAFGKFFFGKVGLLNAKHFLTPEMAEQARDDAISRLGEQSTLEMAGMKVYVMESNSTAIIFKQL